MAANTSINMTNQEKTQAVLEAVRNTEGLEHLKVSTVCRALSGGYEKVCQSVQWIDVLVAIEKQLDGDIWWYLDIWGNLENNATGERFITDLHKTPEQNMLDNPKLADFLYELLVTK